MDYGDGYDGVRRLGNQIKDEGYEDWGQQLLDSIWGSTGGEALGNIVVVLEEVIAARLPLTKPVKTDLRKLRNEIRKALRG